MPRYNLLPPSGGNITADALARHFRKQYFQAFRNGNSSRYMNTIAGRLNGRVKLLKGAGFGATWVVPSVLGLCSVAAAEPELKVRTAFEEGLGVVGGAIGTAFGAVAVGSAIISILCLGPVGMFVTVFICASAGGIIGSELLKGFGGKFYDYFEHQFDTGRIYHSPEQFFLEAVK